MPDSESFEAFYARTVGNVTSQMHALAGDDSAADHAIREAYARAYQQWYEIGRYPDTEGWVLAVAKEAYQRRRPMAAAPARDPARPGHDPLSMPGLFRPAPRAASGGTGETTVAPQAGRAEEQQNGWFTPTSRPGGAAADAGGGAHARGVGGLFGGRAAAAAAPSATATARLAGDQVAPSGQPTQPGGPRRPRPPAGFSARRRRPSATLIALVVVVALGAAGGIGYLLAGGHPAKRPTSNHTAAVHHGKPPVQMLAAGKTGSLSAIPWSLIGTGWTVADVSTAQAGTPPTAAGNVTTYLVDPEGGKYQIQTTDGLSAVLLGWSGNAQNALFEVLPASGAAVSYDLLSLTTGNMSPLPLPSGVTAVGFTQPDGLNILAVNQTATAFQLERFSLEGTYQATIGSLPVKAGSTPNWQDCGTGCGALSSPDGLYAVWGVAGDEMQFISNTGGPVIRRLAVPDSGSPPSCTPLTWWNADTVLANCSVTQTTATRLWLVPTNGATPTPVTGASGSPSGMGDLLGAWQGAGAVYVNSMDFTQCPSAPSGPGGLVVSSVSNGSMQQLSVSGTTNNHTSVVSALDGRLLLLAQTSCPGTYSLLWLNPSTGATQTVLSGSAGQVGVIAAVPYGNGPAAISGS